MALTFFGPAFKRVHLMSGLVTLLMRSYNPQVFLGSLITWTIHSPEGSRYYQLSAKSAYLTTNSIPTAFNDLFRQIAPVSLLRHCVTACVVFSSPLGLPSDSTQCSPTKKHFRRNVHFAASVMCLRNRTPRRNRRSLSSDPESPAPCGCLRCRAVRAKFSSAARRASAC
jgi:hypothetical protein